MSGRRIELSTTHLIASVLAAVSGAILASFLGVAGTIIGAAVVSFATTSGTAVYRHFLRRTEERLRIAAAGVTHRASAWGEPGLSHPEDAAALDDAQPATGPASTTEAAPTTKPGPAAPGHSTHTGGGQGRGGSALPAWLGRPGKGRWLVLGGSTVVIFVLAMLGVTLLEAAAGKPVDALVWGRHNTGTTVGNAVGGSPARARPSHPRPAPTPTTTPSGSQSVTPTPSPSPSGSGSPSPSPSTSLTPSATPSAGATHGATSPAPAASRRAPATGG